MPDHTNSNLTSISRAIDCQARRKPIGNPLMRDVALNDFT